MCIKCIKCRIGTVCGRASYLYSVVALFGCLLYLYGVSSWVEGESEGLIERRLPVMSTHSGLLFDDPFLSGYIHHIQLDIQICGHIE